MNCDCVAHVPAPPNKTTAACRPAAADVFLAPAERAWTAAEISAILAFAASGKGIVIAGDWAAGDGGWVRVVGNLQGPAVLGGADALGWAGGASTAPCMYATRCCVMQMALAAALAAPVGRALLCCMSGLGVLR